MVSFPTTLKYHKDYVDIKNMTPEERANFEFMLLDYDVDKNGDTSRSLNDIRKIFIDRDSKGIFNFKRDGLSGIANKLSSLFISIVIVLMVLSLIAWTIFGLLKMKKLESSMKQFLLVALLICAIVTIIIVFYNTFTNMAMKVQVLVMPAQNFI